MKLSESYILLSFTPYTVGGAKMNDHASTEGSNNGGVIIRHKGIAFVAFIIGGEGGRIEAQINVRGVGISFKSATIGNVLESIGL